MTKTPGENIQKSAAESAAALRNPQEAGQNEDETKTEAIFHSSTNEGRNRWNV